MVRAAASSAAGAEVGRGAAGSAIGETGTAAGERAGAGGAGWASSMSRLR